MQHQSTHAQYPFFQHLTGGKCKITFNPKH